MTRINILPTTEISLACASEKSVRHGHISTLQFWWARRPLAICRSAIFLALCPDTHQIEANPKIVVRLRAMVGNDTSIDKMLKDFSALLSLWKSSNSESILNLARDIISIRFPNGPVILDPFAGGGSIPLEGLRLGARVVCGDLNPVAFCSLELAVKFAPKYKDTLLLAYNELSTKIHKRVQSEFKQIYSESEGQALAYIWARTYVCPACKKVAPLVRSKVLAKGTRNVVYQFMYDHNDMPKVVITLNPTASEIKAAGKASISATGAECENCGFRVPTAHLQKDGIANELGEMAIASYRLSGSVKSYFAPDQDSIQRSEKQLEELNFAPFEDIEFDKNAVRHIWAMQYGINTVKDVFNKRQFNSLRMLQNIIIEEIEKYQTTDIELKSAIAILFAQTLNRLVMYSNRHSWWQGNGEFPANIFVRQAISMVWDYVEIPPNSENAGGWKSACSWISKILEHLITLPNPATVYCGDAASIHAEDASIDLVFTDPPYFDSITYAYLSDLFFAWMRPVVSKYYPTHFIANSTPKTEEAIVDRKHKDAPNPKGSAHFQNKMFEFYNETSRVLNDTGILMIMYGHKKPAAWSAFFDPMAKAGILPFSSIPIHTERKVKFKHSKIDALATSCLISCRKGEGIGKSEKQIEWNQFIKILKNSYQDRKSNCTDMSISGGDLLGSFISDAVTLFYSNRVLDEHGKKIKPEKLFAFLQEIDTA